MYRVFLGAPSIADLNRAPDASYHWEHFTEQLSESQSKLEESQFDNALLPPSTLAAASRRISRLYENIIFQNDEPIESQESERGTQSSLLPWK